MTSKLKFNPNAKSYVPETKATQTNNFINNQPNQSFFEFKSVYPENGMEDLNQYVDKILGTSLPDNSEETIVVRKTCLELSGAQKEKFPGSLAANLSKYNAALTRTKNYMISHNPDGSRYLLLTINDNIYLLDRSMRVFNATKLFSPSFIHQVGNNTLIDGYILKRKEVENQTSEKSEEKKGEEEKTESSNTNTEEVNNKGEEEKTENSKTEQNSEINYNGIHFLVVDGICIKDQTVRAFHIEPRMKNIEQALSPLLTSFKIVPKQPPQTTTEVGEGVVVDEKKDATPNEKFNEFPPSFVVNRPEEKYVGKISISVQQYYPASQLENMFKKHFPSFGFPRVGILFSPSNEIYKLGYNEFLLLWKPMEQITVDFKVGIVKKMNKGSMRIWYQLLKSTHGELVLHDWITEKGGSKLSKLNEGQVIRCFWDPNGTTIVPPSSNDDKSKEYKGGWVMRTILNKTQPNEEWVVSKLVENIESHIGKQDLIKVVTTDKDLGDDFKLAPSRFAPKKRSFWKPNNAPNNNGNNNNYNGNKGYNNNYNGNNNNNSYGNNSYNNNGNYQNGNFNHHSSSQSHTSPNETPINYSQNN